MLRKLIIAISLVGLINFYAPSLKVKADAGLTLGIIGTSLGGAALGLSALNSWSMYRRGFYGGRRHYYGGYVQPAYVGYSHSPYSYGYPAYSGYAYGNGYYGYVPNYYGVSYGNYYGYRIPRYYGAFGGWGGY
ncbi:MAG: hypothetical protein QNJ31_00445 [Candidatus Caenarcaniphilales bacterium]|nr:hypothetical protein [Candidatus Caenarcaniphilales bacterium]